VTRTLGEREKGGAAEERKIRSPFPYTLPHSGAMTRIRKQALARRGSTPLSVKVINAPSSRPEEANRNGDGRTIRSRCRMDADQAELRRRARIEDVPGQRV